jgi:hypothetical protein
MSQSLLWWPMKCALTPLWLWIYYTCTTLLEICIHYVKKDFITRLIRSCL